MTTQLERPNRAYNVQTTRPEPDGITSNHIDYIMVQYTVVGLRVYRPTCIDNQTSVETTHQQIALEAIMVW